MHYTGLNYNKIYTNTTITHTDTPKKENQKNIQKKAHTQTRTQTDTHIMEVMDLGNYGGYGYIPTGLIIVGLRIIENF